MLLVLSSVFSPLKQPLYKPKYFLQLFLVQFRSDYADPSRIFWRAVSDFMLLRYHIKVNPFPVFSCNHSFCTQYGTESRILF